MVVMRWAPLGIASIALGGCLQPKSHTCAGAGETWVCPADLSCAAAPTYCGTPQEVGACDGKMDRDPCTTPLVPSGLCVANVCEPCSNDIAGCRYVGWNAMTSPSSEVLSAIAFVKPGEAYAAGDNGTVLHYDQAGWEVDARFPALGSVAVIALVAAGDKVYALTNASKVYVLANNTWTKLPVDPASPLYKAMWAAPSGEVVLAGAQGHLGVFDGATWTETTTGVATLEAVWGASASDVYAAGASATILHYDGATWTPVANPGTGTFFALWGTGGDVFAAGTSIVHANGGAFATTATPLATTVRGLWGSAGDDVFGVGDAGVIVHWDGVSWTQMIASTTPLHGVGGSGAAEVVAVGDAGVITRFTGAGWATPNPPPTTMALKDIWAAASNEVIAVGVEGAFHLRDTAWTRELTTPLNAVAGRTSSDALVAATNTGQHWNGTTWTAANGPIGLVADLWATPATYYAVADTLSTFDGSTWSNNSAVQVPSTRSLWVAPSGRVWFAGTGVQRLDGSTLTVEIASGAFDAIWGAGEADVFAAGIGEIRHYDGTSWTAMTVPTTNPLTGIWGRASDDVFAVGSTNTVLHYHAGLWQTFATPFIGDLTSVSGAGSSIYATAADGKVYRLIDTAP